MMQLGQLAQLRELAALKKEMELAKLSRILAQRSALLTQGQALRQAEQAARHAGLSGPVTGQMAEKFAAWTAHQTAEVARDLAALDPRIEAQRAIAAKAFGRTDVLQQLESRQKLAALGARSKL